MWCRQGRLLAAAAVAAIAGASTAAPAQGGGFFYQGPLVVQEVSGTIDLQSNDQRAAVLDVKVENVSRLQSAAVVAFRGTPGYPVTPGATDQQTVPLSLSKDWAGNSNLPRQLRMQLGLDIDGKPLDQPIGDVDVWIKLPPGVPALIGSSMTLAIGNAKASSDQPVLEPGPLPEPVIGEDGRVAYRLLRHNWYLTQLDLIYNPPDAPVTLDIKQTLSATVVNAGDVVQVGLRICNRGAGAANQVVLEANYDMAEFGNASGPDAVGTFAYHNDQRLAWTYTTERDAPSCASGEYLPVKYYLRANVDIHSCLFHPVTATIDRNLVGMSNIVAIY